MEIVHELGKGNSPRVNIKMFLNNNNFKKRRDCSEVFSTKDTSLLWLESQNTNQDHLSCKKNGEMLLTKIKQDSFKNIYYTFYLKT